MSDKIKQNGKMVVIIVLVGLFSAFIGAYGDNLFWKSDVVRNSERIINQDRVLHEIKDQLKTTNQKLEIITQEVIKLGTKNVQKQGNK